MLLWPGVCIVTRRFPNASCSSSCSSIRRAGRRAPGMPPHIIEHADHVGSTSSILQFAKTFTGQTLIVATEPHIIHQMELALPDKTFVGAPGADGNCNCNICPYMALNTMEKLYTALRDLHRASRSRKACASRRRRASTGCSRWPAATIGKGDLGPSGD